MKLLPLTRQARFFIGFFLAVTAVAALLGSRSLLMAQSPTPDTPTDSGDEAITRRFVGDLYTPTDAAALAADPCVGGMADIYPCDKVDLLAFMPLADIGGGSGNDIWGWTDPLTSNEYALMGRSSGTSFIDITDPENPIYLGNLPSHNGVSSSWRDIKVYADHAFIVSEAGGHGMQVFDLTELRTVTNPPVTFAETAHYAGFGSAHNLAINEDTAYAYAVGAATCSAGLTMVNISTPTNPTDAGCFSADGYTHDTQCVVYNGPDTTYQGREICFNANEDTLTIVDVEDKNNPVQLSRTPYVGSAYTHQGWLTEDHTYFLLDDELDEVGNGVNTTTYIWDVSDLDNPVNTSNYVATNPSSDHNLYIRGNLAYLSNYRSGLRILDISDVGNGILEEIAYFDVYPEDDNAGAGGSGSWSNYPYFDSGVVIVSSIDRGLFILGPTLEPDFNVAATPDRLDICAPADAVYDVTITQIENFTDTVTLSTQGTPAGADSDFSQNPVTPPAMLTFTISNTGAATPGAYDIDIIGMATTRTHTATVTLNLFDAVPGITTLITPTNGATEVAQSPLLGWAAVTQPGSYWLELATDGPFTDIIYTTTVESTTHQLGISLDVSTTYYWRVTTANACGGGGTSAVSSFTTVSAPVLFYTPDAIEEELFRGDIITNNVTISNLGDLDLAWYAFDLPLGDELYRIDVEATTTSVVVLGVEYVNGHYWVTTGGLASNTEQNYLFELDDTGAVINTFIQPTVSTWGWRDLAYDGTYLYGSDSAVIEQIDPATGMPTGVTIPSPHNPGRGLAYDPATDHFWVSDQDNPIYEIDRSGAVINMYPNPITSPSTEIYGLAWDSWSAGGPYLWTWSDTPNNNGEVTATQIDPATGTETGISFRANELDGAAGGATISPDVIPGVLTFVGLQQTDNDTIVGYELSRTLGVGCATPATAPYLDVTPIVGTLPMDASEDLAVRFDASGLATGVYTDTLCITSNDPATPVATIPLTYSVVVSAVISIESPADGAVFTATNGVDTAVPMVVTITNGFIIPDDGHWHILVDGNDLGPVYGYTHTVTLTVGSHSLAAQLQDPAHNPLGSMDAISVTVTAPAGGYDIFLPIILKSDAASSTAPTAGGTAWAWAATAVAPLLVSGMLLPRRRRLHK